MPWNIQTRGISSSELVLYGLLSSVAQKPNQRIHTHAPRVHYLCVCLSIFGSKPQTEWLRKSCILNGSKVSG